MSVTGKILKRVEERIPKVIDSRAHGALDYLNAGLFLFMAWRWRRKQPRAAVAALLTGSFVLAEALFTDYPLGAVKVLPFSTHGRIDKAFAATSLKIPKVFGFEGTAESALFLGETALDAAVAGMTDYSSEKARWPSAA